MAYSKGEILKLRLSVQMKLLLIFSIFLFFSISEANPGLGLGDPAPHVEGVTEQGTVLRFSELYKKYKYVVVFFYPKANSPGCTAQAGSLRDHYEKLKSLGVEVIGVSVDDGKALSKFKKNQNLPFPLVSDVDQKIISAFGVGVFLGLAKRQAFLIQDGKIFWMDRAASTKEQAQDILKALGV